MNGRDGAVSQAAASFLLACLLAGCGRQVPAKLKADRHATVPGGEGEPRAAAESPKSEGDFRWSKWGASRQEVKESEEAKPFAEDGDSAAYSGKVAGLESEIVYSFIGNQLVSGGYVVEEKHAYANIYIDDFGKLKDLLAEKYGKPKIDRTTWRDDLFRNDPGSWGTAVSTGRLALYAEWKTPTSAIKLSLKGDNFKTSLVVGYYALKYESLAGAANRKKARRGL